MRSLRFIVARRPELTWARLALVQAVAFVVASGLSVSRGRRRSRRCDDGAGPSSALRATGDAFRTRRRAASTDAAGAAARSVHGSVAGGLGVMALLRGPGGLWTCRMLDRRPARRMNRRATPAAWKCPLDPRRSRSRSRSRRAAENGRRPGQYLAAPGQPAVQRAAAAASDVEQLLPAAGDARAARRPRRRRSRRRAQAAAPSRQPAAAAMPAPCREARRPSLRRRRNGRGRAERRCRQCGYRLQLASLKSDAARARMGASSKHDNGDLLGTLNVGRRCASISASAASITGSRPGRCRESGRDPNLRRAEAARSSGASLSEAVTSAARPRSLSSAAPASG